jgi:asparagine N-glycosylation enzyme membrane subunit Stt3
MWNMLWPILVVVVIMRALLEESHGILRFAQDDN